MGEKEREVPTTPTATASSAANSTQSPSSAAAPSSSVSSPSTSTRPSGDGPAPSAFAYAKNAPEPPDMTSITTTTGEILPESLAAQVKHVTPLLKPKSGTKSLIQGSVSKETAISTHAKLYGVSEERIARLRELYDRLDMDNDGTIDIRDLTAALTHEMPHIPSRLAPQLLARITAGVDPEKADFSDFVRYVVEHEKQLEGIFRDLDRNSDGLIDVREIKSYCDDLGVPLTDAKAQNILDKMDQTGNSAVDLREFKEFMLFYPSAEPHEIADFWRHNLVIDIGEDSQIPEDFTPQEIQSGVWWRHLLAGGSAGCMSRTCTAPLDRIKVYLQVHANRQNKLNVFRAVRLLYDEGGVKSFWRGNGINVVKIAPESAIKFMAYEQMKRLIQRLKGSNELEIYERFVAGSTAGAISQSIIYPMEVLKTRLALRKTGQLDKGLIHFSQKIYRADGLIGFYKGYVPNLIGIIPYAGIDLAIYETLKNLYSRHWGGNNEPGVLALLACGTCSSTCGQLASYPLALIRTRLQARTVSTDPNQPDTMTGQIRYILKNEGFTGLYRGITPNFMKVIPAVSISYVVYETVRKHLGASMS